MRQLRTYLLAIGVLLGGCMGAPDSAGFHADLIEIDPSTEPLEPVAEDEWEAAPAGCEGRLGMVGGITFRLASATDGLVAAVDGAGRIVCVDTVESVQEELEEQGEEERADELGDQYLLAAHLASLPVADSLAAGDPSPQPNCELAASAPEAAMDGARSGDPTPQPNSDPR